MIGNEIFDPCYTVQDKTTIVCGALPDIDKPSGFILKLTNHCQHLMLPKDLLHRHL
jgi:hypothetical protein